jgi:ubiquitin C-terminal hydrolase
MFNKYLMKIIAVKSIKSATPQKLLVSTPPKPTASHPASTASTASTASAKKTAKPTASPISIRTGFNATSLLESDPIIMPLSHAPQNIGNSCFLNSILQVVTLLPEVVVAADPSINVLTKQQNISQRVGYRIETSDGELTEYSLEETTADFEKRKAVQLAFHNVLNEMFNSEKSVIHLRAAINTLWKAIQAKQAEREGIRSQQDSVWPLTAILDSLDIHLPQDTIMSKPGTSRVYSVRTEGMIPIIHASIIPKRALQPMCTVQEAVTAYHMSDLMTGVNKYSHYRAKVDANKTQILKEDPPFIAVQLKRYKNAGTIEKPRMIRNSDNVDPSVTIDLPIHGKASVTKNLIGISCQSGGLGGGHYIAYRQAPDGNIYKYNDSSRSASLGTKWDELPSRELASIRTNAYLLMYK